MGAVCHRRDFGLFVGGAYICWAGDTRLFAKSTAELSQMARTLEKTALRLEGIELRLPKCRGTPIQRQGQDMPEKEQPLDGYTGDSAGSLHEGCRCLPPAGRQTPLAIPGSGSRGVGSISPQEGVVERSLTPSEQVENAPPRSARKHDVDRRHASLCTGRIQGKLYTPGAHDET